MKRNVSSVHVCKGVGALVPFFPVKHLILSAVILSDRSSSCAQKFPIVVWQFRALWILSSPNGVSW